MAPGMEKGKPLVVEAKQGQTLVEAMAEHFSGAPDPWRHRSAGMSCATCMWFVLKNEKIGRCRRHAPTMSGYPAVFSSDWCGDHKIDETKL